MVISPTAAQVSDWLMVISKSVVSPAPKVLGTPSGRIGMGKD